MLSNHGKRNGIAENPSPTDAPDLPAAGPKYTFRFSGPDKAKLSSDSPQAKKA
jgi:hypothetical protein